MIQNNMDLLNLSRSNKKSLQLNSNWWFHDLTFLKDITQICESYTMNCTGIHMEYESPISDNQEMLLAKNLAVLCSTEIHVSWHNKKVLGLECKELDHLYNSQFEISMNYLISKKHYKEAINLARFISSYDFINKLFINLGIDFRIEDFIEEWGNKYLVSLVHYSCQVIVEGAERGQSYKVNYFSIFFLD
jgi:hypothetical protein